MSQSNPERTKEAKRAKILMLSQQFQRLLGSREAQWERVSALAGLSPEGVILPPTEAAPA